MNEGRFTAMKKLVLLSAPAILAVNALLAACTPEEKPGIPITGTLNNASGAGAQLTLGETVGTGFTMNAVLDGMEVAGSGEWACYAPFPPDFPNFDIEATDRSTYGLFISISPAVWSSGAIQIDNDDVKVLVAAQDRFGFVTSGALSLFSAPQAPDQPGSDCSFALSDLSLEGEKDAN